MGQRGQIWGKEGEQRACGHPFGRILRKWTLFPKPRQEKQLSRALCGSVMLQEELTFSTKGQATAVEVQQY